MSFHTKIINGLALGLALSAPAFAEVKTGQTFPDLAGAGLEGSLPECKGQVVLVDFWATWCSPCKASFPAYSQLQRELAPRGFVLLAVSVDKSAALYADFLKEFNPAFPTVRDGSRKLITQVKVPAMPTSYLIDRKGVVRSMHHGFHGEATVRELREEIIRLLEEKS